MKDRHIDNIPKTSGLVQMEKNVLIDSVNVMVLIRNTQRPSSIPFILFSVDITLCVHT